MPAQTLEHPTKSNQNGQRDASEKRTKTNRGNFANDPARAREAGRKGGRARGKSRLHQ
jgi:general stress protein YciG